MGKGVQRGRRGGGGRGKGHDGGIRNKTAVSRPAVVSLVLVLSQL